MPISEEASGKKRLVVKKLFARQQHEGFGAVVRRSIGRFELRYFDPFLVLDEFSVSAPAGFPDHPHRGFETVTYMLEGEILHEDCEGHKGVIREGGLQWMTAGKGIVHSEMPSSNATGTTRNKGLQLWINLSSKHKLVMPSYQEIESKDIAEAEKDGVRVRIIAGEWNGVKSKICTRTPTMYLDFTLTPGSKISQHIPLHWNAFVYVLQGHGHFGDSRSQHSTAAAHHLLILGLGGDRLEAWNGSDSGLPLRFILVGGEPIGEPVVQFGPFVMNTQEEIDQTVDDFENFTNGFEKARHWKSQAASDLGLLF
ncbi:Pirin-like protein [Raphanus sativus]|uniref:Pirin-like protein At1g50590 n=1 Tax=Raphanus sativus TaxID=3726 RepID=A0A6J0M8R3_RAPSA|nr:pirin-like protein At1g50590 [Raphanus sativus]KAJ4917681.1 Pirin-like protein [Raphanus sativus]